MSWWMRWMDNDWSSVIKHWAGWLFLGHYLTQWEEEKEKLIEKLADSGGAPNSAVFFCVFLATVEVFSVCSNDVRALLFDLNHIIGRVLLFFFLLVKESCRRLKRMSFTGLKSHSVCELGKLWSCFQSLFAIFSSHFLLLLFCCEEAQFGAILSCFLRCVFVCVIWYKMIMITMFVAAERRIGGGKKWIVFSNLSFTPFFFFLFLLSKSVANLLLSHCSRSAQRVQFNLSSSCFISFFSPLLDFIFCTFSNH